MAQEHEGNLSVKIGKRAFISAAAILFLLLLSAGIIGRIVPPGSFERRTGTEGRTEIIPGTFSYHQETSPLPVWRWFTAPVELLAGNDGPMVIAILLFMLFIAGSIAVLAHCGLLKRMVEAAVHRWAEKRRTLIAVLVLVFMLFGSFLGTMEESLVLVPLAVSLSLGFGWDPFMGAALSLGAMALGFSAAVSNPFTVGVALSIAGLSPFSGAFFRLMILAITYAVYLLFLFRYVRRFPDRAPDGAKDSAPLTQKERRSIYWFGGTMVLMVATLALSMIAGFSDGAFPLMVLFFLTASLGAALISGYGRKSGTAFLKGVSGIAPGIILVLMAAGVKQIMQESRVLDTILHFAAQALGNAGSVSGALLIYLLVLFLNFFISSGSAKAFLVMPIVAPLTDLVGIGRQTAVLAFMFGDGYSNIIYPTNALLLICLAMTGIPYTSWLKKMLPLQLILLLVSISAITIAALTGY